MDESEHRNAVREALAGYAVGAERIAAERRQRLTRLTVTESFAIFDDLVATAEVFGNDKTDVQYEEWRLEYRLAAQAVFVRRAEARGLL